MAANLKILILEDNQSDADLLHRELKKSGLSFTSEIVQTREEFENALQNFKPDIILSDYSLPAFDAVTAFRIKQNKSPDIPFIIVSGIIGEENAVELIKNGVTDYAPKDKLFTLSPKINRALKDTEEKKEKEFIAEKLKIQAAELIIANKELVFQNEEKEKRAAELIIANKEKEKRAADVAIVLDNAKRFEEVKVLNKKKDEFIALASHELKTPVTSISAYLQFLQRNLINDEKNKQLTVKALQQVKKLEVLIADLLDVSKIESGKLPLLFSTFDILDLLKEVTEMVLYENITHKIETRCDFNQMLVKADKDRIEQVIINLISNAIKYSPNADHVIISASQTENDVVISLQDFGIGIKEDQQVRIFSRFYRVEDLAPHMSGLGIGLYICHEIISRHNGKLYVESKFGEGSTFYFKIPKGLQGYIVPLN